MDKQESVCAFIVERKLSLIDEHGQRLALPRPGNGAELGRHQRAQGLSLAPIGGKIWRGKADAKDRQAFEVVPTRTYARAEQPAHHDAERAGIEILEVDGVELHGPILTLLAFSVSSRLLPVPFQSPLRGCYGPGRP